MFYNKIILDSKSNYEIDVDDLDDEIEEEEKIQVKGVKTSFGLKVTILPEVYEIVFNHLKEENPSIDERELKSSIEQYLTVKIAAYPEICKCTLNVWKHKLDSIERVFNQMTNEEIAEFVLYLIKWNFMIKQVLNVIEDTENQTQLLHNLCNEISNEVNELDDKIKIYEKAANYGNTLKLIDDPKIGSRDQDTPELTFKTEEVRHVCNIAIISKIFLPIFCVMITESKKSALPQKRMWEGKNKFLSVKNKVIDTKIKEIYCLSFIEGIFKKHIPNSYNKLTYYVHYFVLQSKRKLNDNECSDIFMNNTPEELTKNILANVICKKYVTISLYDEANSIMGKTVNTIRQRVKAFEKGPNSKAYFIRSVNTSDNDTNIDSKSQLEVDSIFCDKLLDIEPIMRVMWEYTLNKYIKKYEIDRAFLHELIEFNKMNSLRIDYHMPLFLSTVFSEDLGGSEPMEVLNYEQIITLISLLQIIAIKKNYYDLAFRLGCNVNSNNGILERQEPTLEGQAIIYTFEEVSRHIFHDLLSCKTQLVISDKNKTLSKEFKIKMKNLAMHFANYKVTYLIHPKMLNMINLPMDYMDTYSPSRNLLAQYCQMLYEKI